MAGTKSAAFDISLPKQLGIILGFYTLEAHEGHLETYLALPDWPMLSMIR